jgi:tripartite-type tricarboxylate transporter receptor subunit TctC
MPDVRANYAQQALDASRNSPAEFAAFLRSEVPKWAQAIKESGAKAE